MLAGFWVCASVMLVVFFDLKPHSLAGTAKVSVLCSRALDVTLQDFSGH